MNRDPMNREGADRDRAGAAEGEAALDRLHQIAERLWATSNYVQVLRVRLPPNDARVEFAEKAAQQLDAAIEEFRRLRDWITGR